jgi:hypothetical protein
MRFYWSKQGNGGLLNFVSRWLVPLAECGNQRSGLSSASCVFHGPEIPSIIPWVRPAHTHTEWTGEGGGEVYRLLISGPALLVV